MAKRVFSRTRSPKKRTSEFASVSDGGMFESRPFVVQSKVGEEGEKSGFKTSLMRAERYGHHLDQICPTRVLPTLPLQPKMTHINPNSIMPVIQKMENSDTVTRRSKRLKTKTWEEAIKDIEYYIEAPKYVLIDQKTGGKKSTAILNIRSYQPMGTDADSNLPKGIKDARKKYPSANFKAGHLLNADFGGDGKKADNLTILTASANTAMTTFDNQIKSALQMIVTPYNILNNNFYPLKNLKAGISIEVEVSDDKWGQEKPDSFIANKLFCKANPIFEAGELDDNLSKSLDEIQKRKIGESLQTIKSHLNTVITAQTIDNSRST